VRKDGKGRKSLKSDVVWIKKVMKNKRKLKKVYHHE